MLCNTESLQFISEHLLQNIIVWPSEDELDEIADFYETLKGFPGVVGMVDGTQTA